VVAESQFLLIFVPLFLLGAVLIEVGFDPIGYVCMVLGVVVAIAGFEAPKFEIRRRVRARTFGTIEITIDGNGVAVCFPFGRGHYQWQIFTRYRETDAMFLLRASHSEPTVWIPKRVLSLEQMAELRQILNVHLPNSR
jgi:hypothetical protein